MKWHPVVYFLNKADQSSAMKPVVGYIGLGHMGGGMAARLIEEGFSLNVYDSNPQAMEPLAEMGAKKKSSVVETAAQSTNRRAGRLRKGRNRRRIRGR